MKKRPPLWKRLVLSVVTGAGVAVIMRAVRARPEPAVPAPSKEWPPLPDLAAPAASATPAPPSPVGEPVPGTTSSPDPSPAASPVSAVVVTPAARVETAVTAPDPAVSSPPPDAVDAGAGKASAPTVRVPGDGPGGAVGTIVTEGSRGTDDRLDDRTEGAADHERPVTDPEPGTVLPDDRLDDRNEVAADQEHPVTDPEPEAVLPDERIDRARDEQPLTAAGDGDVPPAPDPTFGTVPDPEAAAGAPVPVATPVETGPEEPLPIPHRAPAGDATGEEPATEPVRSDPGTEAPQAPAATAAPRAKRGSSSAKASEAAPAEGTGGSAARNPWIVPGDGGCPGSHPVKAELSEGRFHVPGGAAYDSATADRCYLDAGAAEADGLRPADG